MSDDDVVYGHRGTTSYLLKPGLVTPETFLGVANPYGLAVGKPGSLFVTDAGHLYEIPLPR